LFELTMRFRFSGVEEKKGLPDQDGEK